MNKKINRYLWTDKYLEFSFESDVCLHIDRNRYIEWKFDYNWDSKPYIIVIEDIKQTFDQRFWQAINLEVASDKNAAFRFSKIRVFIPVLKNWIPFDWLEWFYWKYFKSITNMFIDTYRYITWRFQMNWIETKEDIKNFTICSYNIWENTHCSTQLMNSLCWMTTLLPNRPDEEIDKIESILNWEDSISLHDYFYMNSIRLFKDNHRYESLVMLVVSLEIVTKNFLYKTLGSEEEVSNFMKTHNSDWLKEVIRVIDEKYFNKKNIHNISKISEWIKLRNDIIHIRKWNIVDLPRLKEYIDASKIVIDDFMN